MEQCVGQPLQPNDVPDIILGPEQELLPDDASRRRRIEAMAEGLRTEDMNQSDLLRKQLMPNENIRIRLNVDAVPTKRFDDEKITPKTVRRQLLRTSTPNKNSNVENKNDKGNMDNETNTDATESFDFPSDISFTDDESEITYGEDEEQLDYLSAKTQSLEKTKMGFPKKSGVMNRKIQKRKLEDNDKLSKQIKLFLSKSLEDNTSRTELSNDLPLSNSLHPEDSQDQENHVDSSINNNEKIVEASYHIAFMVAQQKKPHTLGETLIKPSILKAVEIVLGEESKRKIAQLSLSDNTVKRRIDELALDIKNQLIHKLKHSVFFAIQCDESTDVANCCQLLVYCRFINEQSIAEELLFSQALNSTSKGSDVLSAIDIFFDQNGLSWKNVVGVCTDGAPAMLGSRSGFVSLAKNKNPSIIGSHCVIHR
ncbi:hypothetical protein QTP88_019522 [Uroleucon formosanum]